MSIHVNYDNMYSLLSGVIGNLKSKINSIDLTDQQKSQLALIDKIIKTGDGSKYLSNDGTYKNIPLDKIQTMVDNLGVIYNLLKISYNNTEYWDSTITSPISRHASGCVQYNGKIYCIGGNSAGAILNRLDIYNISNKTWSTGTAMPAAKEVFACIQINGKIYCIGGSNSGAVSSIYVYDIATNTWSTSPTQLPVATGWFNCISYNNKIYLFGGATPSGYVNTVRILDLITNTWSTAASLPGVRNGVGVVENNSKVYCLGGYSGTNTSGLNDTVIYDLNTNTYSLGSVIPVKIHSMACEYYDNKIYCIGGRYGVDTTYYKSIYIYDILNNKWSLDPNNMINARSYIQSTQYNNKIYIIGGYNGTTSLSSVEILCLIYQLYSIQLPSAIQDKLSLLITNGIGTKLLTDNGTYQEYIPTGYREMNSDEMNTLVNFINTSF